MSGSRENNGTWPIVAKGNPLSIGYIETTTIPAKITAAVVLLCSGMVAVESVCTENKTEVTRVEVPFIRRHDAFAHKEDSHSLENKQNRNNSDGQSTGVSCLQKIFSKQNTEQKKHIHNKHTVVNMCKYSKRRYLLIIAF